jgi:hypothetical protein
MKILLIIAEILGGLFLSILIAWGVFSYRYSKKVYKQYQDKTKKP